MDVTCDKCKVSGTCPKRGSSPLLLSGGRRTMCRLVGNYGRIPLDREVASKATLALMERDGPCMTLMEIPTIDPGTGGIIMEVTKIFSQPVRHERETTTTLPQDLLYPRSHARDKP